MIQSETLDVGLTAEFIHEFGQWLKKKYRARSHPLTVLATPTTRDRLFTNLRDGYGEIAAGNLTITPERHTVPVSIALFRGRYQVPWGQILAAAVVATIPVAVIVLAFQRRIVAGLTAGSVKG